MPILITRLDPPRSHVMKVDGQLSSVDTTVLLHACEAVSGQLVLDLSDLRFADRCGVGALRTLKARGAMFVGLSPYLDLLLGETKGS